MEKEIISSFEKFSRHFPKAAEKDQGRCIKRYFDSGNILSIDKGEKDAGKLMIYYPTLLRINFQLKQLDENISSLSEKEREWRQRFNKAKVSNVVSEVKKFTDKLYWKHMFKNLTDKEYRDAYSKVKLPTKLVSNERFRPMVDMFVNNTEYRQQLAQTVDESIVYANRNVADYSDKIRDLRMEISEKKAADINERLNALLEEKRALQAIQKLLTNNT